MFARVFANIRRVPAAWLLKTPVRIALGLFVAYLAFAWLAFEPLVKWAAPKFIADKSAHRLELARVRFDPFALALRVQGLKLTEPDGQPLLAFDELLVDFDGLSLFKWAYAFDAIELTGPHARAVLLADGRLNWSALMEAFKSEEEEPDKPLPRLIIRHFKLAGGRLEVADRRVGFQTRFQPLELTLSDISTLPDDKGRHAVAATTEMGARLRWQGEVMLNPMVASGSLDIDRISLARLWPYLKGGLRMAPPQGQADLGLRYRVAWKDKRLDAWVNDLNFHLNGLALRGVDAGGGAGAGTGEPAVRLDALSLTGGRLDLGKRSLEIGAIALKGGRVAVRRDAAGRLDLLDWLPPAAPTNAAPATPGAKPEAKPAASAATNPATWHIALAAFSLDDLALRLDDAGFAQPLAVTVDAARLGFSAEAEVGGAAPRAVVRGLNAGLDGLRLRAGLAAPPAREKRPSQPPGGASLISAPFFSLDSVRVEDAGLDLAEQTASLRRIALTGGRLEAVRGADGALWPLVALQPAGGADAPKHAAAKPPARKPPEPNAAHAAARPWQWRLDEFALGNFAVDLRDEGVRPAVALNVTGLRASARGLTQDHLQNPKARLPVTLALNLRQGGAFEARGDVLPARPAADLKLKLTGLALAPAQPYLTNAANLTLASGSAAAQGRLRFDGAPRFEGGFAVNNLLLNETEGGARFLAWKTLASDSLRFDGAKPALAIEELRLDGLGAKLIIDKDKSVNLKKIMKSAGGAAASENPVTTERPTLTPTPLPSRERGSESGGRALQGGGSESDGPSPQGGGVTTPNPSPQGQAASAFALSIERIRVENGELDFADHSLALPFGTRVHALKGAFDGVTTARGGLAQLEMDGQVDEYGLARAVGQLDLFDPTGFMDIKVVFKNVEMANLTPYSATFAGRKIDSGKLSLDLEYKIKQRQLLGENQLIMDRLTLGERVESPTAKNLPLDLAIAILEDSDGRIDLGLPVSGSLDDPQFSYGAIIWKAIGNVLTKIVTAPFRALGKLFGGDSEKLEKIAFEAGSAQLTPPEKEKFKRIAQALAKRPRLGLTVHPAWSAERDRPVMMEARLRRAVALEMGQKLAEDEEAGPVSTANPKARTALEALYAQQAGAAAWKELERTWRLANPQPQSGGGKLFSRLKGLLQEPETLSAADEALLKGADLHALLYQRLLARQTVSDADLAALAARRGAAIVSGLVAQGVPPARARAAAPAASASEAREIPARLELGVAGQTP